MIKLLFILFCNILLATYAGQENITLEINQIKHDEIKYELNRKTKTIPITIKQEQDELDTETFTAILNFLSENANLFNDDITTDTASILDDTNNTKRLSELMEKIYTIDDNNRTFFSIKLPNEYWDNKSNIFRMINKSTIKITIKKSQSEVAYNFLFYNNDSINLKNMLKDIYLLKFVKAMLQLIYNQGQYIIYPKLNEKNLDTEEQLMTEVKKLIIQHKLQVYFNTTKTAISPRLNNITQNAYKEYEIIKYQAKVSYYTSKIATYIAYFIISLIIYNSMAKPLYEYLYKIIFPNNNASMQLNNEEIEWEDN